MFPGVTRGSGSVTGQFSAFQLHHWRGITDNKWLLDTLEKGYCLQFRHRPQVSTQVHPTVVRDPHQVLALLKEIQNLLEKGAIEPVDPHVQPGGFHSKYFLVRKKDGSFRPMLDLRHLNESLKRLPFRMLRIVGVRQSCDRIRNVVHFSGPEGCVFSHPHHPTLQKVPSVHFSKQNLSVQSPSVRPVSFSQGVHTHHSGGVGATSTRRHADSSVPGRLAVVRQIIPTGCRQHTTFVVSCSHIGSKDELSEELPNPKPVGVFSGNAVGFQGNESYPHCGQMASIAGNSSKVPGSLQAALHQLPMIGRPSHGSIISHPTAPLTSSPISTLVNSQTLVTSSQSTHTGSGHNQLCCLPETLEEGQVSSEGSSSWAAPSTQRGGNHGCLPQRVGRTVATPWCTGQLEPTIKGLSHQSSGTMGGVSDFETFQARTVRETHSGKDGQYNSGIFNQPPGGTKSLPCL